MATRAMNRCVAAAAALGLAAAAPPARAAVTVTADRREAGAASADFKFDRVPPPSKTDAAARATFAVVAGKADGNGADLAALHDGAVSGSADDPGANFFFGQGEKGGRIKVDLRAVSDVSQVNTYSWHRDARGPQVYKLYGADGKAKGFDPAPKAGTDPAAGGWTLLAAVDTRPKAGPPGGQYGVSVADDAGKPLGAFRYLLLDASATEADDPFGNTFFSEIDVVATPKEGEVPATGPVVKTTIAAGKYEITIDPTGLDDATAKWAEDTLRPVCETWYPKIVEMLPSDGYVAPKRFGIVFRDDMKGTPAAAAGTRVMCNRQWFEKNLKGEAAGAVVHEMVHVVQQYKFGRKSVPFWLQEGIPDYVRWFLYEPEKKGAEIRNVEKAKYDAAYRVSANFLNWATLTYDKQLVPKVNAAVRSGKYADDLWKDLTGKTLPELDAEWKASLAKK
ncbi:MAG: Plant Basic Secretory Protein [Phycisphaerales bacterium]|nr:Plant Basic Secretory Protein [Phycisphaerales bacterium]